MGKPTTYQKQVSDRTKVLHGPRTQTYGETNYLRNQVLDRTKELHGPWTQTYGETNYLKKSKFWTESMYCMVFGLKPMGKPTNYQNRVLDRTKVLHGPRTQTYGETNYLSKSSFGQNQGIAWSSDSNL